MIAARDERLGGSVAGQSGINRTMRHESRPLKVLSQVESGCYSTEIIALRAGAVRAEGADTAAQRLKRGQLSQAKTLSQHKTHARCYLVFAHDEVVESAHLLHLQIVGIGVISPAVLVSKEWLASILGTQKSQSQIASAAPFIAQGVAIGIAQVSVLVARPLIGGYANGGPQ